MTGTSAAGLRKRHALQLYKTDICKFFTHSRCENGDNCSYAHTKGEVRQKPDLTRTSMCKAMSEVGFCTDSNCRFAHNEAQLRATHGFFKMKMCGFAQSGRCKHGESCRFAHSREELRPPKPLPAGVDDQALLARRPTQQVQQHVIPSQSQPPDGRGREAASVPGNTLSASQEFNMNNFIFGKRDNTGNTDVPPPPEPFDDRNEVKYSEQRQQQRQQQRRQQRRQTNQPLRSGRVPQSKGANSSGRSTIDVDAGGGVSTTQNENDSADASSWASGSSATELPRSEHTGTPPTTSDSSSNNAHTTGGTTSSSMGNATSNSTGDQRSKHKAQKPPKETKVTTLLVINVPTYLTQGALLSMLEDLTQSMRGNYDFYYCPWDERNGHNMGYALVNFPEPYHALEFQQQWTNRLICRGSRGQRPLRVLRASVQGLQANLEYFSKVEIAACSDLRFRPLYRDADSVLQPLPLQMPPKSGEPLIEPPPTFLAEMGMDVAGHEAFQGGNGDFGVGQLLNSRVQEAQSRSSASQSDANMRRAVGFNGGQQTHGRQKRHGQQRSEMLQQFLTAAPTAASNNAADAPGTSSHGFAHNSNGEVGDTAMQSTGFGGGFNAGASGKEEYWMAPGPSPATATADRNAAASAGHCTQQVLTWPMMMTAVPWPPGPMVGREGQRAAMSTEDGPCPDSAQDQYLVGGSTSATPRAGTQSGDYNAGNPGQAQQVLYHQQMAPYMMTVMEPMMPVGGDATQMEQSMMSPAGSMMQMMPNMWVTDEVYMD